MSRDTISWVASRTRPTPTASQGICFAWVRAIKTDPKAKRQGQQDVTGQVVEDDPGREKEQSAQGKGEQVHAGKDIPDALSFSLAPGKSERERR
jgi:hypothetical protein